MADGSASTASSEVAWTPTPRGRRRPPPHLRWDALSAPGIAVSPASVEFFPPHRSVRLTKIRASVETATLLFINDTLPEASAARLAAVPVVPRDEHEPFIVEPVA